MSEELRLVRNSERSDFKRCPWLWHESWIKGLSPAKAPTWSWFGTAIHKGLEVRYPIGVKRGSLEDTLDAFEESVGRNVGKVYTSPNNEEGPSETEVVDAVALGKAMLAGYIKHFGEDDRWEVIHTEQSFQIDVPSPYRGEGDLATLAGTWDVLMRDRVTGKFWIWDHKTRRSFPSNWGFYQINDQAGTYLWVAPEVLRDMGIFGPNDEITGLVFNALRKAMPDTRPVNHEGKSTNKPKKEHYVDQRPDVFSSKMKLVEMQELAEDRGIQIYGDESAVQPPPLFHREEVYRSSQERVRQAERAQTEIILMQDMLNGDRKVYKNPTEDCVRCKLFDYCSLDESDPEGARELAQWTLKKRDPYADHREAFGDNGVAV